MATTTPNYGWDVPTSTDYVKDGATAIETLGDDIDATLYSVTNGRNVGLSLVSTGTIGSGVTTFSMDNVFTSAFRNYQIIINAGQTQVVDGVQMQLRASGTTETGSNYLFSGIETQASSATLTSRRGFPASNFRIAVGSGSSSGSSYNAEVMVYQPAIAAATNIFSNASTREPGSLGNVYVTTAGSHQLTNAYDGFTLSVAGATTMTGGTVQVYGMRTT
jgi:hypothetical protein